MREIIATGRTVEEATENGCRELGKGRDEVSVEILEMPVKKLFKTLPAKVRVTVDEAEPAPAPAVAEPKASVAPAPTPAPAAPAPQKAEEKAPRPQPVENTPKMPENKPAARADVLSKEPEEPIDISTNKPAAMAVEYLTGIFAAIGSTTAKVTAHKQGDATLLRVEGEDISEMIETRGETVQALSYLTDRTVNRGVDKKDPDYIRVRLDVAGYRGRREGELISLANRTAKEVIKNNRSRTLAPMNPYERLIIHTTISEIDGVMSESIGSDTERRVVVKSTAPGAKDGDDWSKPRRGGRDRGSSGRGDRSGSRDRSSSRTDRGGNRDRGPRREQGDYAPRTNTPEREYADKPRDPNAAPVVPDQREAIKDGDDLPLYGKIEL